MIYVYGCPVCEGTKEEFRKVDDRNVLPDCDLCKTEMHRVLGGHNVSPDIHAYYDDNLQCGIESRQHRQRVMKEQGVYERYGSNWHTAKSSKSKRH